MFYFRSKVFINFIDERGITSHVLIRLSRLSAKFSFFRAPQFDKFLLLIDEKSVTFLESFWQMSFLIFVAQSIMFSTETTSKTGFCDLQIFFF